MVSGVLCDDERFCWWSELALGSARLEERTTRTTRNTRDNAVQHVNIRRLGTNQK